MNPRHSRPCFLAGVLCLLGAACGPPVTVDPGVTASVSAPYGFLAIGFAFESRVVDAQLCSELECVNVGPFESIEDVVLARLREGEYCLQDLTIEDRSHRGYGRPAGPLEVPYEYRGESPVCRTVRAGALTYFGHVGLRASEEGVGAPTLVSTEVSMGVGWHSDIDTLIRAKYPSVTDVTGNELHVIKTTP